MLAREFLRALGIRNGVIAVLRAALDASSCHPHWIYAVAGYVGTVEAWDAVLPEWDEGVSHWKIPRFHLCELADWLGHEKAHLCEKFFSNIIHRSELHSCGSAIFTADWFRPDWGEDRSPRFSSPYEQSLWFALDTLGTQCELEFPGQPVVVICDTDGPEQAMQSVFRKAQELHSCLDFIGHSSSFKHHELQCADLAAGSLRRSWATITTDDVCDLPWGVIPQNRAQKGRTSVWSLRTGAILRRAFQKIEILNSMHERKAEIAAELERLKDNPDGLSIEELDNQIFAIKAMLELLG